MSTDREFYRLYLHNLVATAAVWCILLVVIDAACPLEYPQSPAPVTSLYVVSEPDTFTVTIQSLAGLLARSHPPMVYRISDTNDSYNVWLEEMETTGIHVDKTFLNNPTGLIEQLLVAYNEDIQGVALFDDGNDASLYAAVSYCAGAEGVFVVPSSSASSALYGGLEVVYNGANDPLPPSEALQYSDNMVVFQQPGAIRFQIDYAVFARAPFMQWDDDRREATLARIAATSRGCACAFGW